MLKSENQRTDYRAAAGAHRADLHTRDVVIDASVLSPGPVSGLDAALGQSHRVLRAGVPQERDHPFGVFDQVLPVPEVVHDALAEADGGRVFVVSLPGGERVPGRVSPTRSSQRDRRSAPERTLRPLTTQNYRDHSVALCTRHKADADRPKSHSPRHRRGPARRGDSHGLAAGRSRLGAARAARRRGGLEGARDGQLVARDDHARRRL